MKRHSVVACSTSTRPLLNLSEQSTVPCKVLELNLDSFSQERNPKAWRGTKNETTEKIAKKNDLLLTKQKQTLSKSKDNNNDDANERRRSVIVDMQWYIPRQAPQPLVHHSRTRTIRSHQLETRRSELHHWRQGSIGWRDTPTVSLGTPKTGHINTVGYHPL